MARMIPAQVVSTFGVPCVPGPIEPVVGSMGEHGGLRLEQDFTRLRCVGVPGKPGLNFRGILPIEEDVPALRSVGV
jgi:hypothetical protein